MSDIDTIDPSLVASIRKIEEFVEKTTGAKPTQKEIAQALTKYFVLKEILEFIQLSWEQT
ncbi:MAG: hypothetical protein GY729_00140 [Desulfobacteraceae bacterium]|nr:hypothetical protein [Desulfobacteraceae bacterium]